MKKFVVLCVATIVSTLLMVQVATPLFPGFDVLDLCTYFIVYLGIVFVLSSILKIEEPLHFLRGALILQIILVASLFLGAIFSEMFIGNRFLDKYITFIAFKKLVISSIFGLFMLVFAGGAPDKEEKKTSLYYFIVIFVTLWWLL